MSVQSVFNYGIILENNDRKVAKLFDEINLKLDKNHHQAIGSVCVDIMDIDDEDNIITGMLQFNTKNCYDEDEVFEAVKKVLSKKGVKFSIDDTPDVDDNGMSYDYCVYIYDYL